MRWISRSAAKEQLTGSMIDVNMLIKQKVLPSREHAGRIQVALDEDVDGPGLMARYYALRAPCTTPEDFEKMRVVGWHTLGKKRAPPPDGFINDALRAIERDGHTLTVERLRAYTGVTEELALRLVLDETVRKGGSAEDIRSHFRAEPGDHEAAVLARLPPELQDAPGTYRGANGHPDQRPQPKFFGRLASIKHPRLFNAGFIALARTAAKNMGPGEQERYLAALQEVDRKVDGRGIDDPYVVRERLEAILGVGWVTSKEAKGPKLEVVNRYRLAHEQIDEYLRTAVPADRRKAIAQHQLVLPAGHAKFLPAVKAGVTRYLKACTASRQARIEKILDHPLEFLLVGRTRLLEHIELRDALRKKIDALIAKGRPLTRPFTFQHPYTTRLVNERFRLCEQTIHVRIWTWDLLHEAMHAANVALGRSRHSYGANAKVANEGRAAFVVEFVGVTPKTPGGPTQIPLLAEVADSFILDQLASLDDDQRRRRDAACRAWGFPDRVPAMAAGLPHFLWSRRHSAREANKLLTGPKLDGTTGRVLLIAHEECTQGLEFAHSSVFISADAGCRTSEAMQAPADPRKYETRQDPKTGDVFKEFDAICKGGPPALPQLVSPDTFKHLTNMIVEGAKTWHGGRAAPPVGPNHCLAKRGIKGLERRAFAVDDRMINPSELATLHRVLYLGWHGLRGHDVRHIFNALGRRAGISREVRQRLLHHADPRTTDLYGPATPGEVSKQQMLLLQHLSERMAGIRDSSAGEMSEAMRRADIEMRRAEMNMRFYHSNDLFAEAEEMRREVDRWATELARATSARNGGAEVIDADAI